MGNLVFKEISEPKEGEILRIHREKRVTATLRFVKYRDKDTRQIILYIPSLEISSYGATEKKAKEMLRFSIKECFEHFMTLPTDKLESELSKLGWKHAKLRSKEYSKAYIDMDGNLKDFNAVADQVEEGILTL